MGEKEKALTLGKHCSAMPKTLVHCHHRFSHKSRRQHYMGCYEVNSISAKAGMVTQKVLHRLQAEVSHNGADLQHSKVSRRIPNEATYVMTAIEL